MGWARAFVVVGEELDVRIDGFHFALHDRDPFWAVVAGLPLRDTKITLRDNIIIGASNAVGSDLYGAVAGWNISRNLFEANRRNIDLRYAPGPVLIEDNLFLNTVQGNVLSGATEAQILGNRFIGTGSDVAMSIEDCVACRIADNEFEFVMESDYYGLELVDGRDNVIVGNTFSTSTSAGHPGAIHANSEGITIENNVVGTSAEPHPGAAIWVLNRLGTNVIRGNQVAVRWGSAVTVLSPNGGQESGSVVIEDNHVTSTTAAFSLADGPVSATGNVVAAERGFHHVVPVYSDIQLRRNDLSATERGVQVNLFGAGVDATCNWWGDALGPDLIVGSTGAALFGPITFAPWLTTDDLEGPCDGHPAVPSVTITSPAEGARYEVGSEVFAEFVCEPGGFPVESCTGTLPGGARVDTSKPGQCTFTVTAEDVEGATRTETVAYEVVESGEVWVDSVNGNDNNRGTQAAPFRTIEKGVEVVASGGIVHVAAGVYTPHNVLLDKSLILRGAQAGTPGYDRRDPAGIAFESMVVDGGEGSFLRAFEWQGLRSMSPSRVSTSSLALISTCSMSSIP